jgi:peptide/nickel transport system substrate-binding protein
MNRRSFLIGSAASAALVPIALSRSAFAEKANNTLRWASAYPIDTIDPYYNVSREMRPIMAQLVWDTLIISDPTTGEFKPVLATSWKWLDDKTLEFELRDGVKWHDGSPFTVEDVLYTFNYLADPTTKTPRPQQSNWIASAEASGPKSFKLLLKQPFPPALDYLSSLLPIVKKGTYAAGGKTGGIGEIFGTGPYKITKFEASSMMEVEKAGTYFDGSFKGQPLLERITFRTIPDNSTQIAELLSGGVDWIWNVPFDQAQRLATQPGIKVRYAETMRLSFIMFNTREMTGKKNALMDVRVRKAVAHAIDREAIIKTMVGEGAQVPRSACYKSQFGCYQDVEQYAYDPAFAKKLLAEAGFANGVTLDLQSSRSQDWTTAVAGYLEEVGIKTDINFMQYAGTQQRYTNNEAQLYLNDNGSGSVNDASAFLGTFFPGTPYDGAQDAGVTAAIQEAGSIADGAKRQALYATALKRIADQMYMLPMWTHPSIYAFSEGLEFSAAADENPRFFAAKWV